MQVTKNETTYQLRDKNRKRSIEYQNERKKESTWMSLMVSEEEMAWERNGFIRCVHKIEDIDELQQKCVEEGLLTIKIIPMGGEKVFIKVDEDKDFKELLKESQDFFHKWFSAIREWKSNDTGGTHYIWCRVMGS